MSPFRLAGGLALAVILGGTVRSAPLDEIYDEQELALLQPKYERGWRDNYDSVFSPRFTAEERARFSGVRFVLERRLPGSEPFGFAFRRDRDLVIASTASLMFLEEVSYAYAWLNAKGYDIQSVGDYLMMLNYWDAGRGRPPKPLAALCITRDDSEAKIADLAARAFNIAAVFALLHEYGHAFYRHAGNAAVPAAESRVNEEAADRFALDVIARTGDVPIGVTNLFFIMAYLHENRAFFKSDAEFQRSLAGRTHPLSPQRLQAFARHLSASSGAYAQSFRPGAKASALLLAQMISSLALRVGDTDIQKLSATIGASVSQDDLAPRRKGQHLAAPCNGRPASGQPFDGVLRGRMTAGRTPFEIDVVLERYGDAVSGSYSYGAGFGRLKGSVNGATLNYRWTMSNTGGMGVLTLQDGTYRGTWGNGDSSTGAGALEMTGTP